MTDVLRRPALGMRGASYLGDIRRDVVVIDTPDDAKCSLPSSRRLCVSTTCAAALTGRLPPGVEHQTRCAFDEGKLQPDHRKAELLMERRRIDCVRLDACEEVWILEHVGRDIGRQARCPTGCLGFVKVGGLVPAEALARANARGVQAKP